MNIKAIWKKIWHFLWKENSIWSWLADIALILIIAQFIFFPLMSLIFATPLPFVIIESNSMHHSDSFDKWYVEFGNWYTSNGITLQDMEEWSYRNGLDKGDLMAIIGKDYEDYKVGDIIIFKTKIQDTPVIHRIVAIEEKNNEFIFSTKGDNNQGQISFLGFNVEKEIKQEQVLGTAVFRVPWLGWVKLVPVEIANAIF